MPKLTRHNIEAAKAVRQRLSLWDTANETLRKLSVSFPNNTDSTHVLAKASAIDKLYSTRSGNIYWVKEAVVAALTEIETEKSNGSTLDGVDVVDRFSDLKLRLYPKSNRCTSFASKYCHFFVAGWQFPIYDGFALAAVKNVLGKPQTGLTKDRTEYRDFCERVDRLRRRDGLEDIDVRDLDRFLWLWGQWLAQHGKAEPVVNREVYSIFVSEDDEIRRLLSDLEPKT